MKSIKLIAPPAILFVFLLCGSSSALASFSDVGSSHDNSDAIGYMQSHNIVQGYSDGTFKPDRTINRAEFTKIIMGAVTDKVATNGNCFSDVKDEWFAPYICTAKSSHIIDGYTDGSFKPSKEINFAEASKIIVNAFKYSVGSDAIWYKPFVSVLGGKSAIPTSIGSFTKNITRGDMAEMIYRLKANVTQKTSNTYAVLAGEQPTETLKISKISETSAMPMKLLTVSGSGYDANSKMMVRFSDGKDFSVDIPAVEIKSGTVKVSVPPLIIDGELAGGNVSVQLVQTKGSDVLLSNTKPLKVEELPTPAGKPGVATIGFLNGAVTYARDLQKAIKGTTLDTPTLNASIANQITNLDGMAKEVKKIMDDNSKTYQMGTYNGKPVMMGSKDLRNVDRLIMGMLLAQAGDTASVSMLDKLLAINTALAASGGCQAVQARTWADQLGTEGEPNVGASTGYYGAANSSVDCNIASAFNTSYLVIGGAAAVATGLLALAGAPAIALALPTAALLYVTLAGGAGMIGVGGALGQASEGARQLVEQGVEQIDSQFRDIIIGQVIPETADTLRTLYEGGKSLWEAFSEAIKGIVTEPDETEPVVCSEPKLTTYSKCTSGCDSVHDLIEKSNCINTCIGNWLHSDCP